MLAYVSKLSELADTLGEPQLLTHIARFLYRLQHPDDPEDDPPIAALPYVWESERVSVYYSGSATFFAASEQAGPYGMHRELIRCNPAWYGAYPRYDTVLVSTNQDAVGMDGMTVARVRSFFSFTYGGERRECALVEWFELDDFTPDDVTGMWIIRPELTLQGDRVTDVIAVQSIVRACHLIGVYGTTSVPDGFDFTDSLDAFRRYYVNRYADYHAHEMVT